MKIVPFGNVNSTIQGLTGVSPVAFSKSWVQSSQDGIRFSSKTREEKQLVTLTWDPMLTRSKLKNTKNAIGEDIAFDNKRIYNETGHLNIAQKLWTKFIQLYQRGTRHFKVGDMKPTAWISGTCAFKAKGLLSCSEYSLMAVHQLGFIKGIAQTLRRLAVEPFGKADPVMTYKAWLTPEQIINPKYTTVAA